MLCWKKTYLTNLAAQQASQKPAIQPEPDFFGFPLLLLPLEVLMKFFRFFLLKTQILPFSNAEGFAEVIPEQFQPELPSLPAHQHTARLHLSSAPAHEGQAVLATLTLRLPAHRPADLPVPHAPVSFGLFLDPSLHLCHFCSFSKIHPNLTELLPSYGQSSFLLICRIGTKNQGNPGGTR